VCRLVERSSGSVIAGQDDQIGRLVQGGENRIQKGLQVLQELDPTRHVLGVTGPVRQEMLVHGERMSLGQPGQPPSGLTGGDGRKRVPSLGEEPVGEIVKERVAPAQIVQGPEPETRAQRGHRADRKKSWEVCEELRRVGIGEGGVAPGGPHAAEERAPIQERRQRRRARTVDMPADSHGSVEPCQNGGLARCALRKAGDTQTGIRRDDARSGGLERCTFCRAALRWARTCTSSPTRRCGRWSPTCWKMPAKRRHGIIFQ
jgi:hypothetical protein